MSYASEVLADAPNAYYRMQEASGLIQDSSGNGNNATTVVDGGIAYGLVSPITSDPTAKSVGLVNSRWTVPDHATLDLGDVMTLEAWMLRSDLGVSRVIFSKGTNNTYVWGNDSATNKAFVAKANVAVILLSRTAPPIDTWFHYVYTKNGATSRFYLNGVDDSGPVTNQTLANTADPLTIGSDIGGSAAWFGALAELAIYPTELSAARVAAHYNAALNATPSVAWWRA